MAAVSLPVHHHSAGYIISLRIIQPILIILKIPALEGAGAYAASQATVLHMKRLNQTESPIFLILCVLCFQRLSFFDFYIIDANSYGSVQES